MAADELTEPTALPIEVAASLKLSVGCIRSVGDDLYWIEGRPELGGRRVVVRWSAFGSSEVVSPGDLSAASRVHEYGGGAMAVLGTAERPLVLCVRAQDQAIVAFSPGDAEERTIAVEAGAAFGGLAPGPDGSLLAIRERVGEGELRRAIVLVRLDGTGLSPVLETDGFVSDATFDPSSGRLWWCRWEHPSMSWEASRLESGLLDAEGRLVEVARIAGGEGEPATQPTLLGPGEVAFALEAGGPAQLMSWSEERGLKQLASSSGEVSQPQWELSTSSIARLGSSRSAAVVLRRGGRSDVALLAGDQLAVASSTLGGSVSEITGTATGAAWLGVGDSCLGYVSRTDGGGRVLSRRLGPELEAAPSRAEAVSATGDDGEVFGLLYLPQRPSSSPPPVVVFCHGGPTGEALPGFSPVIEAMTSRGLAVAAANYAGSTGFGPAYRHRLDGAWGVADVADCVTLVRGLGRAGRVDASRAAIRGTSAGGFTALLGLTTGAFSAAVSWYGVADLLALSEQTHDFEARYLDRLVGALPEARERYVERSPVARASEMDGAVLLLQGSDDPIVPIAQARSMAEVLSGRGVSVELIELEGESHGFRRAESLERALAAEIAFYQRHLGLDAEVDTIGLG